MLRLVEPDASGVWLLPAVPDSAGPAVLDELGLAGHVLEHPNDTARVLAACLRCCWTDPAGPLWPGAAAGWAQVASVFTAITSRDETVSHPALLAAVRRLVRSGWLLWDEEARAIRLGPRVAAWNQAQVSALRELWRSMPAPNPGATAILPAEDGEGPDAADTEVKDAELVFTQPHHLGNFESAPNEPTDPAAPGDAGERAGAGGAA
jgi:hypothetical protein